LADEPCCWRAEHLNPTSRWAPAFSRYLDLTTEKVSALSGNPRQIAATPDWSIPTPGKGYDEPCAEQPPLPKGCWPWRFGKKRR